MIILKKCFLCFMEKKLQNNVALQPLTTFRIAAKAKYFVEVQTTDELIAVIKDFKALPKLILGGGSNLLFTKDFDGLVVKNSIKGIAIIDENASTKTVAVSAGEIWHEFVLWAIEHDLAGIENMSLIPGQVGASPIQNIGAYGAEIKDVCHSVEAIDLDTAELRIFTAAECHFGYRESVFKTIYKGKYCITKVVFTLNKKPNFNINYGDIKNTLAEMQVTNLSLKTVSDAVIKIRSSKLPDYNVLGNAGSFFKNPSVEKSVVENLLLQYPLMPNYPQADGSVKVPAGWLIEQCGWKGKRVGNTGAHVSQALVLVNYGGATGQEVMQLAAAIQQSVEEKFGITISPEVNLV